MAEIRKILLYHEGWRNVLDLSHVLGEGKVLYVPLLEVSSAKELQVRCAKEVDMDPAETLARIEDAAHRLGVEDRRIELVKASLRRTITQSKLPPARVRQRPTAG